MIWVGRRLFCTKDMSPVPKWFCRMMSTMAISGRSFSSSTFASS